MEKIVKLLEEHLSGIDIPEKFAIKGKINSKNEWEVQVFDNARDTRIKTFVFDQKNDLWKERN